MDLDLTDARVELGRGEGRGGDDSPPGRRDIQVRRCEMWGARQAALRVGAARAGRIVRQLAQRCSRIVSHVSVSERRGPAKRRGRGGGGLVGVARQGKGGVATPAVALLSIGASPAPKWGAIAGVTLSERAAIGALAGGAAGGFTHIALHPIDTVKTKLQVKSGSNFKGPVDCINHVMKQQGVRGFYRGVAPAVIGSIPSSALYFGTYEFMKGMLHGALPEKANRFVPTLAALLGNAVSSAVLVPKEVIKTRMQAGGTEGMVAAVRSAVKVEGVGGLYVGYFSTIMRNAPSNMINFTVFEYLKALQLSRTGGVALSPRASLTAGALSGGTAALLTTPIDVVKTRLMAEGPGVHIYRGLVPTLKKVYAEEGARGLTRGMAPRFLYSTCFNAVGFLAFESVRAELVRRNLDEKRRSNKGGLDETPLPLIRGARTASV